MCNVCHALVLDYYCGRSHTVPLCPAGVCVTVEVKLAQLVTVPDVFTVLLMFIWICLTLSQPSTFLVIWAIVTLMLS
jgi:hypothetical protein